MRLVSVRSWVRLPLKASFFNLLLTFKKPIPPSKSSIASIRICKMPTIARYDVGLVILYFTFWLCLTWPLHTWSDLDSVNPAAGSMNAWLINLGNGKYSSPLLFPGLRDQIYILSFIEPVEDGFPSWFMHLSSINQWKYHKTHQGWIHSCHFKRRKSVHWALILESGRLLVHVCLCVFVSLCLCVRYCFCWCWCSCLCLSGSINVSVSVSVSVSVCECEYKC